MTLSADDRIGIRYQITGTYSVRRGDFSLGDQPLMTDEEILDTERDALRDEDDAVSFLSWLVDDDVKTTLSLQGTAIAEENQT